MRKQKEEARAQALLRAEEMRKQKEEAKQKARAQALLRAEERRKAVRDELLQAQKMAKEVLEQLAQAGMFEQCLASLQQADNCNLWRSVLECAELLKKDQLLYMDIEGRREGKLRRGDSPDGAGADTDTSAKVAGMAALAKRNTGSHRPADATTTILPSTSVECFPATPSVAESEAEAEAKDAFQLHSPQSPSTLRAASQTVPRKRRRRQRRRRRRRRGWHAGSGGYERDGRDECHGRSEWDFTGHVARGRRLQRRVR
jgi:hypothetical protein